MAETLTENMFPIQTQRGAKAHPLWIPWSVAELAYSVYAGRYGKDQSLKRLAERGGFGPNEMDHFLPDWRERCDQLIVLRSERYSLAKQIQEVLTLLEGEDASERTLMDAVRELLSDHEQRGEFLLKAEAERDSLRERVAELEAERDSMVEMLGDEVRAMVAESPATNGGTDDR